MKRVEAKKRVMGELSWFLETFERDGVFYRRTTHSFKEDVRWSVVRYDSIYKDGFILKDINSDDLLYKILEGEYQNRKVEDAH